MIRVNMRPSIDTKLISNDQLNKNHKLCEVIAITSGKGGVGKSMLSANLAISARRFDKKVLLIDTDIYLGNLSLILGIRPKYGIADVMDGTIDITKAISRGPGNIDVLTSSITSFDFLKSEKGIIRKLAEIFSKFSHTYDLIILDTGCGITQSMVSILTGADKVIVVVTTDPASISDAYTIIKTIKNYEKNTPIYLTINMASSQEEGDALFKKLNLMVHKFLNSKINFGISLIRDDLIAKSVYSQNPFVLQYPNSPSASALKLLNQKVLQASVTKHNSNPNIFERFMSNKKLQSEWDL